MPIDHFSVVVPTAKIEDTVNFLTSSLAHMGFKEHMRPIPTVIGLGEAMPYIWIKGVEGADESVVKDQHVAFTAENAQQVREFHAAALKAGATCNGEPGLRPMYHPGYYGAFVRDAACGINIEVVCHKGEN